jgi:RHS repeat-associated protein
VTTASGSGVNSNDILSAVQHPDPTTGSPSSSQQDSYLVNALSQTIQATDRNGNVHQYTYDVLGRLTSDAVTTLGAGVDGAIRRIQYAYDTQGNRYLTTSYDAAVGGNIVNQVQRVYNGLGQLTGEYQSHSGAVVVGTTPEVQYAYTEMAGGVNNSRLTSITYPSGYVVNCNYSSFDNTISRLTSLSDSGGVLESYKYLGLETVVERDHPQNNVNLTYITQNGQTGDAGDQYTGLDRFGRIVDQNWYDTATSTSTDDFQYGYDRNNNALYRQNALDAIFSELFAYDALNQLTSFQRGTLNATHNGLVGNPTHAQSWTPDALGNFTGVTTDGTTQTRIANQQNEITSISGAGAVTSDANGNTTADGSGKTFVYDAWNRLVAVKIGGTTLAAYGYNGLGERVTETHGTTTTDLYYSSAWQVLEERVGGVVQARNVWSPVYVDALVLRDQSSLHNGTLDQRLYVQQDANWNVTAIVDASGNVLERYVYDPYGAVTVLAPNWTVRGTSAYAMPYLWQGLLYDATVGLYHADGRDISPTLGRPLQADPLGLAPDINDYRWEGNGPTNYVDPSGLAWEPVARDAPDGGRYRLYHDQWYKRVDGPAQPVTPQEPVQPSAPYNPANDPFDPNFDVQDFRRRYQAAIFAPHDNRNFRNQCPSFDYAQTHWILLPASQSIYHRIGPGNENNLKFVSPDGHCEAVFHPDGTLVTDPINAGTYNYSFDPWGGIIGNVPHFIFGNRSAGVE